MYSLALISLLFVGANALVARDGTCCFGVTASGSSVDQIGDGQTRVHGSGLQSATFCIDSNGGITDSQGRGCILTTETSQFQCDQGASPTSDFSVGSNGLIAYNGQTTFYACVSSGNGDNIYLSNGPDVTNCTQTTLIADNCKNMAGSGASCGASFSAPAASAPASSAAPVASSQAPAPSSPAPMAPSAAPIASSPAPVASSPAPVASSPVPASSAPAPSASKQSASSIAPTTAPAPVPSQPSSMATSAPLQSSSAPIQSSSALVQSSAPPAPKPSTTVMTSSVISITPTHTVHSVSSSSSQAPASSSIPQSYSAPAPKPSSSMATTSSPIPAPKPSSVSMETSSKASIPSTPSVATTQPAVPSTVTSHYMNSSSMATTTIPATSQTGTATTSSYCIATTLAGPPTEGNNSEQYAYPHLIIPVSSSSPDTAFGTSYNGYVNSTDSTIFNFDIPGSYSGKTCNLVFLFPNKDQLETTDYTFSGDGELDFKQLSQVATESTTYSSVGGTKTDYGVTTVSPGTSYVISSFPCPGGTAVSYEISEAGSTDLEWFNDWNPSPLGVFITTC